MTKLREHRGKALRRGSSSFPGDARYRSLAMQMESLSSSLNSLGALITPGTSISKAVASLGSQGGTILLSEGEWSFFETLTISRPNVHIVATSPSRTKFTRSAGGATNMIVLDGVGCMLEGIRFVDPNVAAGAVKITADRCSVKNCTFEDVGGGVHVIDADWTEITGNHIIEMAYSGIVFDGTCAYGIVANNRFEGSNASYNDILMRASVTSAVIAGNVFEYSNGEIDIVGHASMQTQAELLATNSIDNANIQVR